MNEKEFAYQEPAEGILKTSDFGVAKFYHIACDCGNEDDAHEIEVEADDMLVTINIYHTLTSKFWSTSRWKQIWQILTRGYIDVQSVIVLKDQAAYNYAETLRKAAYDVTEMKKYNEEMKKK